MKLTHTFQQSNVATVFVGYSSYGNELEFVESTQPPLTFHDKEVVIVSTLVGCPVACSLCDAGGFYMGKLIAAEILEQIDYVITNRFGGFMVPSKQFKIQFARMGEPALNDAVLEVLETLPYRYQAPGLFPSLSTVAPVGREPFFETLLAIKEQYYQNRFQFQFSVHSTDPEQRKSIVPIKTWNFSQMSRFGESFVKKGDRKVTLNFALAKDFIIDTKVLRDFFSPEKFLIKITPTNPTYRSAETGLISAVDVEKKSLTWHPNLIHELKSEGFEVILSIGELSENQIGSNCGQFVKRHLLSKMKMKTGYRRITPSLESNP